MYFENLFFITWRSNFENLICEGAILEKYFSRELFLKSFWNVFFEGVILKIHVLRKQSWKCILWGSTFENVFSFWKCVFWGSNLENIFFQKAILKVYFLREQFWKYIFWESNFENAFFKGTIFIFYFLREQFWKYIFWENNFKNAF